ncbi:hydroxyacylglutathione hydrolase [bacterium]|nr:hydroxyacylglutathione hydrolase [bacterium]
MLDLVTIPCLTDNYAYLIHDAATGQTALVDVPEAAPILATLKARGWRLGTILLTHHHSDHIQGVAEVVAATGAKVFGAKADAHRLPPLDRALVEGDEIAVGAETGRVIDVSGHTMGHVAFLFPASRLAFTADSLMAGGCGRLFEGTPATMWASLCKLAALPGDTLICSGHEYTTANLRFAATVEPQNAALLARIAAVAAARAEGKATVPSLLSEELATNPFLRAPLPEVKTALGLSAAPDAEVFAAIRARKDKF